jgi:uncharacterized protein YdbL (DUF1318 family)
MRERARAETSAFAIALLVAGCITVNIYFPAPEVRRAAEQIVEETWGDHADGAAATPQAHPAPEASWLSPLFPRAAHAQDVDINVTTAAIRAIKGQMTPRAAQLKPHLAEGRVGIGEDGMLVVRNLEGVPLRDQATVRRLVEAENRDRETLYQEIAKANKFEEDRVADIRQIFAETWIQKAEKGWPIQTSDGAWKTK